MLQVFVLCVDVDDGSTSGANTTSVSSLPRSPKPHDFSCINPLAI